MSVWFAIPSVRPRAEAEPLLRLWADRGYKIALLRQGEPIGAELEIPTGEYLGWARSTNILAKRILQVDPEASWIVGGGDDYEPDLDHCADVIAAECARHFFVDSFRALDLHACTMAKIAAHVASLCVEALLGIKASTFGIMQPTGDRWGANEAWALAKYPDRPAYIDRICGSPWMGREWCRRAYQGTGPMFGGYKHFYADEELQEVAEGLGVLWQRRDLTQMHRHWGRKPGGADAEDVPEFYRVNVSPDWGPSQDLFRERKAAEFPGSRPL